MKMSCDVCRGAPKGYHRISVVDFVMILFCVYFTPTLIQVVYQSASSRTDFINTDNQQNVAELIQSIAIYVMYMYNCCNFMELKLHVNQTIRS